MLLDRRIKKREMLRTIAEYKALKAPKNAAKLKLPVGPVKVSLLDISIGGCSLDSPNSIPQGTRLAVKIDPLVFALEASEKRKEPLEMFGRVTSCITKVSWYYRLGIYFTKIKKKDIALIKRFMHIKERRKLQRLDMTRI